MVAAEAFERRTSSPGSEVPIYLTACLEVQEKRYLQHLECFRWKCTAQQASAAANENAIAPQHTILQLSQNIDRPAMDCRASKGRDATDHYLHGKVAKEPYPASDPPYSCYQSGYQGTEDTSATQKVK